MKLMTWVAFLAATLASATASTPKIPLITADEAARKVAAGTAVLIDVREPDEWAETGVAAPAALLPMSDFLGEQKLWKPFLAQHDGKELLVYCRSGNRSGKVAIKLSQQGRTVTNAGAFKDWAAAGLPVRKP